MQGETYSTLVVTMRTRRRCGLWLSVALFALSGSAPGQELDGRQRFEAAVDVMRIQVGVADEQGAFVTGLGIDDFAVWIDGQPRRLIDVLEVSDATRGAATKRRDAALVDAVTRLEVTVPEDRDLPPAARRHFMIFFDLTTATRRSVTYARTAALEFLDSLVLASDMVGVALYAPRGGLDLLVPFTTNHQLAREALEAFGRRDAMRRLAPVFDGINLEAIAAMDADSADFIREIEEVRVAMAAESFIEAVTHLTDAMAPIQGRKHVMLFSRGVPDALLWGGENDTGAGMRGASAEAVSRARLTDTVIHTFHPGILPVSDVHDVSKIGSSLRTDQSNFSNQDALAGIVRVFKDRQVLNLLAEETGGISTFYRHNLSKGLAQVDEATRSYYVLAFQVSSEDPDQVDIEVRLTSQANVSVTWAPTRLALPGAFDALTPVQSSFEVAEALDLEADRADLQMQLLTMPVTSRDGFGQMALVAQIPHRELARLLEQRGDGGLEFEVLAMAVDPSGTVRDYFRGKASLSTTRERLERDEIPFRYYNLIVVPPGRYYVKFLLRESGTGRMAARSVRFDVPEVPARALRITGPVIVTGDRTMVRGLDPESPPAHRQGRPMAYPYVVSGLELTPDLTNVASPGSVIPLFAIVHNLVAPPSGGDPSAGIGAELRSPSGVTKAVTEIEVVASDQVPGEATRRLGLRLRIPVEVSSGEWTLVLRAIDSVTGRMAEGTLTLTIIDAPDASSGR